MDERTLWFETWHRAVHFAHMWDLHQAPQKRRVWLYYAWREEWSLRVPVDWEIPLRNN